MMDASGIDAGVLTCGSGFDQPDIAICRLINGRLHEAERSHPGRFIGLAHLPALKPAEGAAELKRCAVEFGFPGAVGASELQDLPLDAEELQPFSKVFADLNLYVFIHPLPRVIGGARMDADDLGRMLGWEFSLMTAAVRLINCRLLDDLPSLKILFSHFAGGIGRYRGRICGFQAREQFGTAQLPRHNRRPRKPAEAHPVFAVFGGAVRSGPAGNVVVQALIEMVLERCQCRKTHSRSQTPACASAGGQGAGMNDKPAATETAAFDPARAGWKIVKPIGFGELVGPI